MADANFVGFKATVPVRRRLDVLAAARGGNRSAAIRAAILEHWALRRRFYAALKRAGLRRIRFHDLRHHFGSLAITVLDPYAVQSYMGHQHYSTTQRYLHHKPRRRTRCVYRRPPMRRTSPEISPELGYIGTN